MWEPVTIDRALLAATTSTTPSGDRSSRGKPAPGVDPKERLALALGRIGDREGSAVYWRSSCSTHDRKSVASSAFCVPGRGSARRMLPPAFTRPERGLYGAVSDLDSEVAALALQALAASGSGLSEVLSAIERRSATLASSGQAQNELDVWTVLVPALPLMDDEDRLRAALLGLERLEGVSELESLQLLAHAAAGARESCKSADRLALQSQMRRTLAHPERRGAAVGGSVWQPKLASVATSRRSWQLLWQ